MTDETDLPVLLVVEDDEGLQRQLKWAYDGYKVVIAGDRASAIDALRLHEPAVVTLDLGLPPDPDGVSEGFAALETILTLKPETKVIVASGHGARESALRAIASGAYDFYQKPVDIDQLGLIVRRAFQLHGIIKTNLKRTIKEINDAAMDTIAACGDVNRNVMCNPNPYLSSVHADVLQAARDISTHLTPASRAYHEIWLDGEKVQTSEEEEQEPIYGKTYLPRKFKITIAVPPSNDVDIFANCLSFIAIVEDGKLVGYNVAVGGGMGSTHGNEATYPRIADVIGYCTKEQIVDVAEKEAASLIVVGST